MITDFQGCWDLLIPKLADIHDGEVIWTGATRPDGEIGMFLDCEGDDDLLVQSEIDVLLAHANPIYEFTEHPVSNLLDVSPAWRDLASCDQISLCHGDVLSREVPYYVRLIRPLCSDRADSRRS